MANKPTKEDLIAYLYGELSEKDRSRIDKWLKDHPEAMKEFDDLQSVHDVIGRVRDQEVIDPFFFSGKSTATVWQMTRIVSRTIIKPAIGLAAAISFLILVAYFTGLNISTEKGFLTMSFGEQNVQTERMDEGQIEAIVQEVLEKENMRFTREVDSIEEGLKSQLASYYEEKDDQIQSALNNNSQFGNQALADIVRQMQEDNLEYLERYIELSNRSQEQYIQTALSEFSDFLAAQREEDLRRIQYNLTTLKETQDQQQIETGQILATILNNVNNNNNN